MRIWVTGDDTTDLATHLRRYLDLEIDLGYQPGTEPHILINRDGVVPDEVFEDPGIEVMVVVEPGRATRDRVIRQLANRSLPRLVIIEHVAAAIEAERTWALILSLLTGIHQARNALMSSSPEQSDLVQAAPSGVSWIDVPPPVSPSGLTLGFAGFGPMAWHVAGWASQLGMRVVYTPLADERADAVDREGAALKSGAVESALDEMLRTADMIALDVEYRKETVRLIDAPELALMRTGSWLINTSHGRAIDEGALLQALRGRRLAGVALDRFNYEPLPVDSPLRAFPNVLLTPGIVVAAPETMLRMTVQRIVNGIAGAEQGIRVRNVRHVPRRSSRQM